MPPYDIVRITEYCKVLEAVGRDASNAHEIQIAIGLFDAEGIPTGTGTNPSSYAEPPFRYRMTTRNPQTKMELIDMFLQTAEEIDRLHIESTTAPWFQAYMSTKRANTASTYNPAASRPPVARTRTRPAPPPAAANDQLAIVGSYENYDSFTQAPLIESPASATGLADIATLHETVRSHGVRMTGMENTLNT